PTSGPESSSLLPTPQAHDQRGGKTREQVEAMRRRTGAGVRNLNEVIPNEVMLLPTPTASQPGGPAEQHLARKNRMRDGARRTSVTDLRMALSLLPTPVVNDMGEG